MMTTFFIIFTLTITICTQVFCLTNLQEKFKWKQVEFNWPSQDVRQQWIQDKKYMPENNLPLGLEVWGNKLFLTIPRWKKGVVASLNYVFLNDSSESPVLHPYPSLNEHVSDGDQLVSDGSIVSVFRVRADECDRLWILDTGVSDVWGDFNVISSPAIVIYDLKTDRLIRRFNISKELTKDETFFANIIVDTNVNSCDNAHAYIPDLGSYAVVVYSFKENKAWRVKHHYFHFDPLQGNYTVGGINFQWTDGVFALALDNLMDNDARNVYFHAFSSTKEFMVSNKVLQNETYSTSDESFGEYKLLGDRGMNSQSSAEFFDNKTNVLFYTMVNRDAVGCWNTRKALTPDTQGMVDSDQTALVFPNDLKVDRDGNLWVLSDKLPNFLYAELPKDEVNYRILTGNTETIIKGTPCENEPMRSARYLGNRMD